MKAAPVIKIIVWSVVAVVLIGLFIAITVGSSISLPWIELSRFEQQVSVVREQQFPVENIDSIDMQWTSGNVHILPTAGDKIVITEKSNRELSDKELLQISIQNGRLTMKEGESVSGFFLFSIGRIIVNEVRLPEKEYREIKTTMSSGKLVMQDLHAHTLKAEMTSGLLACGGLTAENVIIDMTSGKLDLRGAFSDIHVESTSGLINIDSDLAPSNLFVKMSSGKTTVTIPDNDGFTIAQNLTSGTFKSDFALDDFGQYKDGGYEYRIILTSGTAELKKK